MKFRLIIYDVFCFVRYSGKCMCFDLLSAFCRIWLTFCHADSVRFLWRNRVEVPLYVACWRLSVAWIMCMSWPERGPKVSFCKSFGRLLYGRSLSFGQRKLVFSLHFCVFSVVGALCLLHMYAGCRAIGLCYRYLLLHTFLGVIFTRQAFVRK